jgi:hypothetical protein
MPELVYRVLGLLCVVVESVPRGTNLGLVGLLWMLVSGRLLESRGAVIPGLSAAGLPRGAVRRAWGALGQGRWRTSALLQSWQGVIAQEGQWQARTVAGYRVVAGDISGFWRPRLRSCPTTHFDGRAGKALPAIPLGIVARIGRVGAQRLGVPLALVRAPAAGTERQEAAVVRAAWAACEPLDVLVLDAGFTLREVQEAGVTRYVLRQAKNVTARRAQPPARREGRGRPATRGALVRPLARTYQGRGLPATPPDWVETWSEGDGLLRAEGWENLVRADAPAGAPTFRLVVLRHPRWREPWVLATPLPVSAAVLRALYLERWPIEQLPLAAKQMLGADHQWVSAPETCQRLPELALLAGAILTYVAATHPALPTGFWDRQPQATVGRVRRQLAHALFPTEFPFPAHIRQKAAVTAHLPKGAWGQRQRPTGPADPSAAQTSTPAA